ncbi:MAG: hypothetical protein GZ086_13670 [Gelidibacter sp.]|nr:hypothetical protein [Gelidibacter sp.]
MKNLKMSFCLLLMVAIFTSCEKETITLPENSEMNVQETEPTGQPVPISFSEIIKSGVDLETYFKSWPIPENTDAKPAYSQIPNTNLQFFYATEDLPCNNLPTEDFENANYTYSSFPNYLNSNTNNSVFSPGDILPGISFVLTRNNYYTGLEYDYLDWDMNNYGFYIWTDLDYGMQNALVSNYHWTDLNINFSANNVNQISMDILNWYYSTFIIYVYGANDNLLGVDVIGGNYNYYSYTKTFWGVKSTTPISKIVINSGSYYYGYQAIIDNVSFGNCDDIDGDGVLNENDAHPNSDISTKINIGGCYPNVNNKMVKNGSTMMDQINDLIAETNAQYNGQNYTYLHKMFMIMTKLAGITYNWRRAGLITAKERTAISICAWSANIPFNRDA